MAKIYSRFFISNALVGGYSTRERTARGTIITGAVDFVPVAKLLGLALRHRSQVSLAGGMWSRVGYKGWGQKVTVSEAKKAVKKLRSDRR